MFKKLTAVLLTLAMMVPGVAFASGVEVENIASENAILNQNVQVIITRCI